MLSSFVVITDRNCRSLASPGMTNLKRRPTNLRLQTDNLKLQLTSLHESAGFPLCGAADGHTVDFNCWDADADGNRLSIFAAGADAFIEFQIVADHRNPRQHIGSVADQGCALDGGRDLAVFDQVCFRRRENKFAVRDVDLTAAEVDRVHAILY